MIGELLAFVAIALVVALVGIGLGMLLARPLSRLAERALSEEDDRGDGRD